MSKRLKEATAHLADHDKQLAILVKKYGPCQINPHDDHYGQLVRGIVGQQLSVKAAQAIWLRVLTHFDDKTPTPKQLLAAETEALRACGLSYSKISYIKDLATHVMDGKLNLPHIATMPNDELIEQLTAVKGIGQWSAHMFMIFGLGRLDILPTGDLGVRKAMMRLYDLPSLPDPNGCESIASNNGWHPYESVAAWYLWQSLDNQ